MDFRLLGPVELRIGDRRVELGTGKQRCVLAVLLFGAGRTHPLESLIDKVWGEDPPTQVRTALYSYVSRARRVLREAGGECTIAQEPGGYLLDVPREHVDVHRFESLSRKAFQQDDPAARADALATALDLWHGEPLQNLTGRWADEVRHQLWRRRVRVCAEWAGALFELGEHAAAGDRLERELLDQPLAEPLAGQLMISLYAQGRQAEALGHFAALRERLAEELGVEPGPALGEIHVRVLRGEPVGVYAEPPKTPATKAAPKSKPARRPLPSADVTAPYLGLETFQENDAARFFGRRALVDEMAARLDGHRFLAVFGPSGSGKSSVLRAGLLPAFRDADTVLLTPGEHPLAALSTALVTAGAVPESIRGELAVDPACLADLLRYSDGEPRETPILLLVDQFEEIFTLCQDVRERAQFVEALVSLADHPSVPARIVIGIRADFYPACADFPALVALLRDRQLLVGPMAEPELRTVITGPAELAGLSVEPALVDAALADVLGEPAALPMLSHALRETWLRRTGDRLTAESYHAAGGVRGAVAQTADEVFGGLDTHQARLAREVFLRLTAPGEESADTRRRPRLDELLDTPNAPEIKAILGKLAEARLVTVDEDTVTVAHECLIRGWPKLRGWLDEDREYLRARHRLTGSAREWERHGRNEDLLYAASQLATWRDRDRDRLTELEREFLAAGGRKTERLRLTRRKRLRLTLAGMSAALVTLLVLTVVAVVQAGQADRERDRALAGRLVADARSQLALDPELALLLARNAYAIDHDAQAESALAQALISSRVRATFTGHDGPVTQVQFGRDGQHLISGGADGTVRFWPVNGGVPTVLSARSVLTGPGAGVVALAQSADGERIAVAHARGEIEMLPTGGGEPVRLGRLVTDVLALAFAADGRVLAINDYGTVATFAADGATQPVLRSVAPHESTVAAFSADAGKVAVTGKDRRVRLWDLATDAVTELRGPDVEVTSLVFGPDGLAVAGGRADGKEEVWRPGQQPMVLYPNRDRIQALAFSHDGKALLSGGRDRTGHLWLLTSRRDFIALRGQGGPLRTVAFSPDDRQIATAADDGTIRLWEPAARPEHRVLEGHTQTVLDTAFSTDGARVASSGTDGTVVVAAADGTGKPVVLRGHQGPVEAVAFSSDGGLVAGAGDDGTVQVWPSAGGDAIAVYTGIGIAWGVAFSPDGKFVAMASEDGAIREWRLGTTEPPRILRGGTAAVRDLAFTPDGRIAAAADNGTVQVWTEGSAEPVLLRGADGMRTVAVSPDGTHVAGAGNDGAVRVWSASGGAPLATLAGHYGLVFSVAFSQDGSYLASVGNDKKLRVWNWARWRDPVVFDDYNTTVQSVAFGPGNLLAVGRGDTNSTVDVWRCTFCLPADRLGELAELAKSRTTRELTTAERDRYLGP
ncbi:BTAD domain-containing putative transcriptional regulator [Amycolatopsis sp. cg5]|uniref:nSTAND1 domain-containing NTPase n=1 Tax=Amycolatopsis sp. cg5 TaxID=3238802 RepID=UPI003525103D